MIYAKQGEEWVSGFGGVVPERMKKDATVQHRNLGIGIYTSRSCGLHYRDDV